MHRFQAVANVGQRASDDDGHRVVEIRALHFFGDCYRANVTWLAAGWLFVVAVVCQGIGSFNKCDPANDGSPGRLNQLAQCIGKAAPFQPRGDVTRAIGIKYYLYLSMSCSEGHCAVAAPTDLLRSYSALTSQGGDGKLPRASSQRAPAVDTTDKSGRLIRSQTFDPTLQKRGHSSCQISIASPASSLP